MNQFWQTKNTTEGIIKDVDMSKRTVSGYFSRFGNIDSDGDIISKGAFIKTINESGPTGKNRIKHLKNHNTNQLIGKIVELKEDATGLYFSSIMSTNTHGSDALIEYSEGILTEHSIGFQVLASDNSNSEYQMLTELKLWEGSAVTWGSNEDTPVTDIKALKKKTIDELQDQLNHVLKVCKVGALSDEYLSSVEININQIKQAITEKLEEMPGVIETTTPKPNNSDELNSILQSFKNTIINGN